MTEETSALLAELTTFLRDEPELVKVNRQLKDKGDRDVKLVEFSPWSQVPDELIERARSLILPTLALSRCTARRARCWGWPWPTGWVHRWSS